MHFLSQLTSAVLALAVVTDATAPPTYGQSCQPSQMQVRREWSTLTKAERLNYINAVKCLQSKPSRLPAGKAPGARSRYDDYIATHINRTMHIHVSGLFLTWHREYIHLYETELRQECGLKVALPYWNWPLWANHLAASPLFDGSATSLSGDGVYIPGRKNITTQQLSFPPGTGGGCVKDGPFKGLMLNFTNFAIEDAFIFATQLNGSIPANSLDYKPHCFRRDLNDYISSRYTNAKEVHHLIYGTQTIGEFQYFLDGNATGPDAFIGPHPGGHFSLGRDLRDFFASPSDPAFFLHHSMIDLVYSKWQAQDPSTRLTALAGTHTVFNLPPSANVTLDSWQDFGYLTPRKQIRDLMSITAGPYCYRYDY